MARAIPLPAADEPLVQSSETRQLSRQVRRQQMRAEAKASRRAVPQEPAIKVPDIDAAIVPETIAPLPRSQSLAHRSRGLAAVGDWFRRLVMVRRTPAKGSADLSELRTMSDQLGEMQRRLDRMIASAG